jgi:hypothetical protein
MRQPACAGSDADDPVEECRMKKVLTALVVAFALFYMLTQPQAAADVVRGAVGVVGDAFTATIAFITALVQ